jgi:hypothetical protein
VRRLRCRTRAHERGDELKGQASIELLGGAVAFLLLGLIGFQLLAVGYAAVMADHAVEAAALALANGTDPKNAAAGAVPGWPRRAVRVRRDEGRIHLTLLAPSPLRFLKGRLAVESEAAVRPRPRRSARN